MVLNERWSFNKGKNKHDWQYPTDFPTPLTWFGHRGHRSEDNGDLDVAEVQVVVILAVTHATEVVTQGQVSFNDPWLILKQVSGGTVIFW